MVAVSLLSLTPASFAEASDSSKTPFVSLPAPSATAIMTSYIVINTAIGEWNVVDLCVAPAHPHESLESLFDGTSATRNIFGTESII